VWVVIGSKRCDAINRVSGACEVELRERCCEVKRHQDLKTLLGAGRGDGKGGKKQE